jgi:hypothetical protein
MSPLEALGVYLDRERGNEAPERRALLIETARGLVGDIEATPAGVLSND